jgi:hypothetical protein
MPSFSRDIGIPSGRLVRALRQPPCRRFAEAVVIAATGMACARGQTRTVPFPCGGSRPAATTHPMSPSPKPGEVVAGVDMPWQGSAVTLGGSRATEADSSGNWFVFRDVPPGRHVLTTRAFGYEPAVDTIYLSDHAGLGIWIRPRRPAACLLGSP